MTTHRQGLSFYLRYPFLLLVFLISLPYGVLSQCPGTGCTYTITGPDSGTYTVNVGEKICFDPSADFTGTLNLFGGELVNCATNSQVFTISTNSSNDNSVVNNYGIIDFSSNTIFTDSLIVNNFLTLNVNGDLDIRSGAIYHNYAGSFINGDLTTQNILINNGSLTIATSLSDNSNGYLTNSGDITTNNWTINGEWINQGTIDVNFSFVQSSGSIGTIAGGCMSANNWTNRGTITGTTCGDINIASSSEQTTSGSVLGDIAIIDATPPGAAPFIDTQNGTVGPNIVWISCNSCPSDEICNNSIDDNGDGRIDEPFPGGVQSDMQLWLKAETGTNTTIDGNDITSWADQSINGYSAKADSNSTDDPIYSVNELNYNPGIVFDGTYTDDFSDGLHLGSDYIYSTNDGVHIFAVVNTAAGGLQYDKVYDFGGVVSDGYSLGWSNNTTRSTTPSAFGGNTSFLNHFTGPAPSLIEFEVKFNNNQTVYKDGAIVTSTPITLSQLTATEIAESDHYGTAANGDHTVGPVSIGRKSASQYLDQNRVFMGAISEVLVYNDTLTQIEKERIQSYLALKYGLTMPHDYTASSGTTIKDITDGFANDIFGIGRDDCSGLNQKQSKSIEQEGVVTLSLGAIAPTNQNNANIFSSDENFLIVGNDGQTVDTWSPVGGPSSDSRINRTWKIDNTNISQNITFTIDMDDPENDIAALTPGAIGGYKIMFDLDGNFSNGGSLTAALNNTTGSLYEITLAPGSWQYFTIVHEPGVPVDEICNNLIDDNDDGRIDEPFPGGVQQDMQLWLKAETGTNTTTNGSDVTSWADQSINGYSADASVNATDYPLYSNNSINFNPGIEFDGDYTDDFSDGLNLGADYIFSDKEGMHVYIVCNPTADNEGYNYVFDFGKSIDRGYGMTFSDAFLGSYSPSSQRHLGHGFGDEACFLEMEIEFGSYRREYRNGIVFSTDPSPLTSLTASNINEAPDYQTGLNNINGPVSIGRKSASESITNDGGRIFNGVISEVLVYNDTLSQIEKERIQSYLALKYGMTLNHNYLSSSGTLIKDVGDGYANNITVIGRDDCSGLNQKQSKSADSDGIISISRSFHAATNAANANNFTNDESFLTIGNNGAAVNTNWNNVVDTFAIIDRIWKIDDINYAQTVDVKVNVDNPNFDLPPMPANANGNYYLLTDDDGDFTNGGIFRYPLDTFDGMSSYSRITAISGQNFFTIAVAISTVDEICNNLIDDNGDGRIDEVFPGGVQQDMQLWLKAEIGTNTTVDGSDVTSWADQSINGYSANADANSTDDPTFRRSAINFNPGIDFDGLYNDGFSDGLHLGSDYIYGEKDGLHVFVVCDPDLVAGTDKYVFDFGLQSNGGYGMIYSDNDYGMYTNNLYGGTNTELFHSEGPEPALVEMKVDFDDAQEFYRNGELLSSVPVTISDLDASKVLEAPAYGPLGTTSGPVSIGRKSASAFLDQDGGRLFNGRISEVIVFTDTLSSLEKQKVNSYLAVKYGLTMTQNYISSTGSIKKDVSDGYANDIAGIGRDDCSGLHQKQSKSMELEAIITIGQGTIASTNELNGNSIPADGTYLMWGNDGAPANANWVTANVSIPGVDLASIDRTWKFSEHFDITNALFQVEVDDPNFDLPAMPPTADGIYYLLRDDDGDFTNGGTTYEPMSLFAGDIWEVNIADPTNEYFTIAVGTVCLAQAPSLSK